jgi:hypothetical protein
MLRGTFVGTEGGSTAHLADPTDVFIAGLLVEAKVLVQAQTNVIAV